MKYLVALLLIVLLATNTAPSIAESKELHCLAQNIYHEARGEPFKGKVAVAQVTLNRVDHPSYRNTICDVVYQPHQFSWTKSPSKIRDRTAWEHSKEIARMVLSGDLKLKNFDALYFHSKQVKPKWAKVKRPKLIVGNHVFY